MLEYLPEPEEIGLVEVTIVSDNDGHEYLIPFEMEDQFDDLLESGEEGEDEFSNLFDQYRASGAITTKLYAKIDYHKDPNF